MFHDALRSSDRVDKCLVVYYFDGKRMPNLYLMGLAVVSLLHTLKAIE
jgi:hypothetical protein